MSSFISTQSSCVRQGQELLNDVVSLFTDLLIAAGATTKMIDAATSSALANTRETRADAKFTELGSLQRDCMEVMCRWRREPSLVDEEGDPKALSKDCGSVSFRDLCIEARCTHEWHDILGALLDFGSVSINQAGMVVSQTPTFLLTRRDAGGRLATDGLLKQLEGYLRVLHRNVRSVSGSGKPRFERACTVSVAIELEPIFDQLVRTRGQEFVDSIDEWLERSAKRESVSGQYVELGAGAYFIDLGECAGSARTGA